MPDTKLLQAQVENKPANDGENTKSMREHEHALKTWQVHQEIIARSILCKKKIPIEEINRLRHGFIFSKIYSKDRSFQVTNLMSNFPQLISTISSNRPNLTIENTIKK